MHCRVSESLGLSGRELCCVVSQNLFGIHSSTATGLQCVCTVRGRVTEETLWYIQVGLCAWGPSATDGLQAVKSVSTCLDNMHVFNARMRTLTSPLTALDGSIMAFVVDITDRARTV